MNSSFHHYSFGYNNSLVNYPPYHHRNPMDASKNTYYADKVTAVSHLFSCVPFPSSQLGPFLRVCLLRGMLGESGTTRVNMNFLYCLEEYSETPGKENLGDLLYKVTCIFQQKWVNLNCPTFFFSRFTFHHFSLF